jgi:hypothetical protein
MRKPRVCFALVLALVFGQAIAQTPAPAIEDGSRPKASSDNGLTLYNFATQSRENIPHPRDLSVERGAEFVPQFEEAQLLYLAYITEDEEPIEAVMKTYMDLAKAYGESQEQR